MIEVATRRERPSAFPNATPQSPPCLLSTTYCLLARAKASIRGSAASVRYLRFDPTPKKPIQRVLYLAMERLGAEVIAVKEGTRILKDAINEAFRDWVTNMDTSFFVLRTPPGSTPSRCFSRPG